MNIEKMKVLNFRNLTHLYYEAHPGLNVFLGDNAQGKTSFLEAIYLLSRPISFRPAKDQDLLQYDGRNFLVEARCQKEHAFYKLAVQFDREKGRKDFFFNEKKSTYKDPAALKVTLFTPDDLYIIKGNPSRRRRFIDFMLCQMDSSYEKSLATYQSLLKKRNLLLRSGQRKSPGFTAVDELFVTTAAALLWERIRLVSHLNQLIQDIFPSIYTAGIQMELRYALSFPSRQGMVRQENLVEGLQRQLLAVREKEDVLLKTLCGPHLDDLNIYLNGRLARNFASQGQQRSLAVALKMGEVKLYQSIKGDTPVFLLDEVLAELDAHHKQKLFDWLQQTEVQSFLTAVNLDGIDCGSKVQMTRFYRGEIEQEMDG